jgi:hypothetical protein
MGIPMTPVRSSNLAAVGYDLSSSTLWIRFHNGGTYEYSGVPEHLWAGLMRASSHGSYHHQHIKHQYPYRRL